MTSPSPIVAVLIDALASDSDALDQLAAALGPRLAAVSPMPDSGPLTTASAARRAAVHVRTITRACRAGTLTARTIAGRWRIEPDDLSAWLDAGAPTSSAPTHHNGRRGDGATAGATAIAAAGRAST